MSKLNVTFIKVQIVKDTLYQILVFVLFANTEKISKKYRLNAEIEDNLFILKPDNINPAVMTINNKMKELAFRR
jgi:3'-phosphoadenosine 5'-phosphosulfate sulfotransferase